MTALQLLGAVVCALVPPVVYAAWLLRKDSRRHRQDALRVLVQCDACHRYRQRSQMRLDISHHEELLRPVVWLVRYVCAPSCEQGYQDDREAA